MCPQKQDQGQRDVESRILHCDVTYAQKRASLDYRKKDLVMRFDLIRQRKQAGRQLCRDPYIADDRNSMPMLSWGHRHDSTKPVNYPDSPTIGPSQYLTDRELLATHLPTATYHATATATGATRPMIDRQGMAKLKKDYLQSCSARIDPEKGYLHHGQRPKSIIEQRLTSLKPSSQKGESVEHPNSHGPTKIVFEDLTDGHLGKSCINNEPGVGGQEYLRKGNLHMPSSSIQESEAGASVLGHNTAKNKSNTKRIHRSLSCHPLRIPPKLIVESSGPPTDRVSTAATFRTGSSKPTQQESLGLNQLAELQEPPLIPNAAVKCDKSRPSLKLDTTFLSSEPDKAEWSSNGSIKATVDSAMGGELNANELQAESDCLHMPLLEHSTADESILASSKISKVDVSAKDGGPGSNENPLDTVPPPATTSPEPQPKLDTNDNKEVNWNFEDELETLTLTSEDDNSASFQVENQLDGTSWEKIDAKGIEQDDEFFHQVTNPQKVGWGEGARRMAWGWIR